MKNGHKTWSKKEVMQLIEKYRQKEILWNSRIPQYKNRNLKQAELGELASFFDTPISEIQRKLHNLRCQLNSEVKKLRRRSDRSDLKSSWEYFDHLMFLFAAEPGEDDIDGIDVSEHLETMIEDESSSHFSQDRYEDLETSDSKDAVVQIKAEPNLDVGILQDVNKIEPLPGCNQFQAGIKEKSNGSSDKKRQFDEISSEVRDDSQIFGDFIASELRNIKCEIKRKKLKGIILRGILEVTEAVD